MLAINFLMAGPSPDVDDEDWTAEEDAYCVWSFFMNPVGQLCDHSGVPNNRPVSDLQRRYLQIMSSPDLQDRVLRYSHGDVIRFRRVKFTKLEDYAFLNAQRLLHTTNAAKILELFTSCFHPSRSVSSITARANLNSVRGVQSWSAQYAIYCKLKNSIARDVPSDQLVPIPTQPADLVPFIRKSGCMLRPENFFETVGQLSSHIQSRFSPCDFYALRGPGKAIFLSKAKVMIGRRTHSSVVDVDLNLKKVSRVHAVISFCTDLRFYIEVLGPMVLVNGELFVAGNVVRLQHGDVVDIGTYLFMFVEHVDLMDKLRGAAARPDAHPA
jgi:hypothetical protein